MSGISVSSVFKPVYTPSVKPSAPPHATPSAPPQAGRKPMSDFKRGAIGMVVDGLVGPIRNQAVHTIMGNPTVNPAAKTALEFAVDVGASLAANAISSAVCGPTGSVANLFTPQSFLKTLVEVAFFKTYGFIARPRGPMQAPIPVPVQVPGPMPMPTNNATDGAALSE